MGNWIRLSDRMPDMGVNVLVYGPYAWGTDGPPVTTVASLYEANGMLSWMPAGVSGYEFDFDCVPTHWAPLPTPPDVRGS